jgi:hypothetical protein
MSNNNPTSSPFFYRLDLIFKKQASLDEEVFYKSSKSNHEKLSKKDSSKTAIIEIGGEQYDEPGGCCGGDDPLDEHIRKTAIFNNIVSKAKKKLKHKKSSTCSDLHSLTYEDCDGYIANAAHFDRNLNTEISMDGFDMKLMQP